MKRHSKIEKNFKDNPKFIVLAKKLYPHITIKKVILGYNYTQKDVWNIDDTINKLAESYHPRIDVELTGLKEYF